MWLRPKILVTRSRTYLKPHIFFVFVWTGPKTQAWCCARGAGGGILPMMAYTGRLRPAGVSFSGLRYMKGLRFH